MKRKILLFSLFIIPFTLFGQIFFGPENIVISEESTILYPDFVFSEDIDGDGDFDVVAKSASKGKIVWYENLDGLGTLSIQQIVTNQDSVSIYDAFIGDIDSDGDMDMVSAIYNKGIIAWYEYEENSGSFGVQQIISTQAIGASSVYGADFDGDGDLDVLSDASSTGQIAWYENMDGEGTFGNEQTVSLEGDGAIVKAGDLDGDGDIDVLVGSRWDNKLSWYENTDGQGNFGSQQLIWEHESRTQSLHIADLDGDGDNDIFTATKSDDKIAWFENEDGQGTFGAEKIISTQADGPSSVSLADIDSDGDLDALSASMLDDKIAWYENVDGQGNFGPLQVISTQSDYLADYSPQSIHASDIDGDGDLDVFATSFNPSKITWFENLDGQGDFGSQHVIFIQAQTPRNAQISDIDGDGDMDILASSSGDVKIAWYENEDGQGTFRNQRVISSQTESSFPNSAVDIDSDGDMDIITVSTNGIYWYENIGSGIFGTQHTITLEAEDTKSFFTGDIDGDGDLDIASASQDDTKIAWYENENGLGSFGAQQIISDSVNFASSIYLNDLDSDDDLDLIVAIAPKDKIVWYENVDGSGTFSNEHTIDAQVNSPDFIIAIDIDGDNDNDILHSSFGHDTIAWYENLNGLGTFGTKQIISVGATYFNVSIQAGDVDNDGDIDVFSASSLDQKIAWYENIDGFGTYGEQRTISNNSTQPRSVNIGDIDGDNDLDVVFTSQYDDIIAWHENLMNVPAISGYCFFDENENKIKDPNEIGLLNQSVFVQPQSTLNFTDIDGLFFFTFDLGDYIISTQPQSNWELTTDSASYHLSVQGASLQNINFGLKPTEEIEKLEASISSARTRCSFEVPFWLNIENRGTTFSSGMFVFEIDSLTSVVDANPLPDSIEGNTYFWFYNNLPPTYSKEVVLLLQMPGVNSLGHTVSFLAKVYRFDEEGELQELHEYQYNSVINCAFDPNDKLVYPEGIQDENYTLFGEEIEYTIRFQNTGTDTAFTVRIEDQLDANLDWSTFRPVAASHSYTANLYETGLAEFLFEDILLPDSLTNEVASHGFVKYRIKPLEGLPENTEIQNTANIFFDFNPPISTNTTLNTSYDCYAVMQFEISSIIICEDDTLIGNAFDLISSTNFQWELIGADSISGNEFSWIADTTGVFNLAITSSNEICTRDTIIQITVNQKPIIEIGGFLEDTICQNGGMIDLPESTPTGGIYSGNGVVNNQFDPELSGLGSNWIYYTFSDGVACTVTDSVSITVEICANTFEINQGIIEVFPNPFEDYTTIRIGELPGRGKATLNLLDVNGRLLQSYKIGSDSELQIKGEDLPSGIYIYELKNNKGVILGKGKLIKQ